jgi:hypothetical protein
MVKTLANRLK